MDRKDIKKRLIDLRLHKTQLAAEIGVSRQMLENVLTNKARTPWIRRGVAKRLGYTYEAMWGEEDPGTPRGVRIDRRDDIACHASSVPHPTTGDEE